MAAYSICKEYGNQTNSSNNNNIITYLNCFETYMDTIFMLFKVFFFLFADNVVKTFYDFERLKNIFGQLNDKLKNQNIILLLLNIYHIIFGSLILISFARLPFRNYKYLQYYRNSMIQNTLIITKQS